jgi:hypothetical protein
VDQSEPNIITRVMAYGHIQVDTVAHLVLYVFGDHGVLVWLARS